MTTEQHDSRGIFGYFDDASETPAYDPGVDVLCPFCLRQLSRPMKTVSLHLPGDARSYFYRSHKGCYENATGKQIQEIESALIDERAKKADAASQSPAEPGRGDVLARQERMAELERMISCLERLTAEGEDGSDSSRRQTIKQHRSELSRLRNEGDCPGYTECEALGKTSCPDCKPSDLPASGAIEQVAAFEDWWTKTLKQPTYFLERWLVGGIYRHETTRIAFQAWCAALQPLSQGNGEAVGWLCSLAEQKLNTVYDLNSAPFGYDHEQASAYCNGRADVLQWVIEMFPSVAAPPSQPEGVREALEAVVDNTLNDIVRNGTAIDAETASEVGRELKRKIGRVLITTPSRGLVEAAEWHDRMADAIPACDPYEKVAWHRDCAKHFRTLSAKGGA